MSKLLELIKESKKSKKEGVVTITLRLPERLNSVVEALADQLSLSRHEMLLQLVEAGKDTALDALKLDDPDEEDSVEVQQPKERRFYLLNTNKRNSLDDHEWMLQQGVAAAFYDPWKHYIDRFQKGDVVFLYSNGEGIVAYGTTTGDVIKQDHDGKPEETHYQQLEGFKVLKKPLPASEINQILRRNFVYLRTMSPMKDGQRVLDRLMTEC
jgi:hypothetical protein